MPCAASERLGGGGRGVAGPVDYQLEQQIMLCPSTRFMTLALGQSRCATDLNLLVAYAHCRVRSGVFTLENHISERKSKAAK